MIVRVYIFLTMLVVISVFCVAHLISDTETEVSEQSTKISTEAVGHAQTYVQERIKNVRKSSGRAKIPPKNVAVNGPTADWFRPRPDDDADTRDMAVMIVDDHHSPAPSQVAPLIKEETEVSDPVLSDERPLAQAQMDDYIERLQSIQHVPNSAYQQKLLEVFKNDVLREQRTNGSNSVYRAVLSEIDNYSAELNESQRAPASE